MPRCRARAPTTTPGSTASRGWFVGSRVPRSRSHERYAKDDPDGFFSAFALSPSQYAPAGGAVPIRVRGALVGVLAVSGLESSEDHELAVSALSRTCRTALSGRWGPAGEFRPGQRAEVWIAGVDGGPAELVYTSDTVLLEAPNWAPDDQALLLNGDGLLWRLDLDRARR